jgi:hypothetical protein
MRGQEPREPICCSQPTIPGRWINLLLPGHLQILPLLTLPYTLAKWNNTAGGNFIWVRELLLPVKEINVLFTGTMRLEEHFQRYRSCCEVARRPSLAGSLGVTGSGHRWYILKCYAPDNIRAFYMRCWPVKVHIVTWKRCNLSEYNWAFHSKCMGQFSCFANLEINRINPHILYPSKVESWVQACAVQRPCNTK